MAGAPAPTGQLIGGEFVTGGAAEPLSLVDPSTGERTGEISAAGAADVDRAVELAAGEGREAWASRPPVERGRVLAAVAAAIRERAEGLAALDMSDAGLPTQMARADAENAARYFEFFAGAADKLHGETIPLGEDWVDFTLREPWGVCGVITPFNVPLQMMARSVAPALATGNTVVVKVAEQAPLAPLALGSVLVGAGVPAAALAVLTGAGPEAGARLTAHPAVNHLTFTGSLPTGKAVLRAAAERVVPAVIELGGKSPQIVFEDADLDAAAAAIVGSALRTAGQVCSAGSRVLAQRGVYEELLARIGERAEAIRVGPADGDPDMGPLASELQHRRVREAIRAGEEAGTRVVAGGSAPVEDVPPGGYFVRPTVFADVDPAGPLAQEEVFGPVLAAMPFGDAAEAIAIAEGTPFGLVAGVWTSDVGRALAVSKRLSAGQVFVNNYGVGGGVELPFGGYRQSGIGREKGLEALRSYTQLKNVCLRATLQ
ncbi:MAG: aldehyde dehydrogenase [Solirubrobacterales bacterium]|nr:aldehyde dehydrogenase [Solirubrobacterales bacterium]